MLLASWPNCGSAVGAAYAAARVRPAGLILAKGTLALALFWIGLGHVFANEASLWKALRTPGHVALIRHALAPGIGDPAAFKLEDCSTQRNLSDAGRRQARRIGERFRDHGIYSARIYSSQWCRCLETARLLELGRVGELPALNSFFSQPELGGKQTRAIRAWLSAQPPSDLVIVVTHQVNITALTAIHPRAGEIVVARTSTQGELVTLGTIVID